ncbi:MAG: preprotein translocase subunit SecY, partial [Hyphomonas sp.]|nr:preprotein translocase subunit SecY [Hyphomonas sp.]
MANAAEQMARNVNLSTFAKAKDLQNRILFTLGMLILYRLGTFIPIPGLDPSQYSTLFQSQSGGMLGNLNMFAGGAVERMGIFALNVMPYITASIIIQMMTSASPTLEKLKKEGEAGRKQINQYTRYLTLAFALVQSFAISSGLSAVRIDGIAQPFFILTGVVTLTGGTMLLMWMGEQITARGIGNGVSLIIFAGIVAEMPKAIFNLLSQARATSVNIVFVVAIAAMVIALVVFIVFMERSQRRLLIQYPKRQQAHGFAQGQKSFLPLKINTSGVIPPIFAS